jgi:hypothetical protein
MHHFTFDDSHPYPAREVADLLHTVYERGKEKTMEDAAKEIVQATAKARAEARLSNYRWLVSGILIGAGGVLLYQVIA